MLVFFGSFNMKTKIIRCKKNKANDDDPKTAERLSEIGNLLGWLSNCLKATIGHYCSHRLYSSNDAAFFFLGSSWMAVISTFIKTEHHRTRPAPSVVVRSPLPPYDVVLPFRATGWSLIEHDCCSRELLNSEYLKGFASWENPDPSKKSSHLSVLPQAI
ncbi:hypothetical protein L1887_08623 [Cichorium endivia]|nr:hypothetical protein L1887_08623 [Cichorium endivia]